jgi:hypothetical protein
MNHSTNIQESKQIKLFTLDKKLEEKRENLKIRLIILKNQYKLLTENLHIFQNNNTTSNENSNEEIRHILSNQIEVLMELINTTKLKINLMQQFENENAEMKF